MRDLGWALLVLGLVATLGSMLWWATRPKPHPPTPPPVDIAPEAVATKPPIALAIKDGGTTDCGPHSAAPASGLVRAQTVDIHQVKRRA